MFNIEYDKFVAGKRLPTMYLNVSGMLLLLILTVVAHRSSLARGHKPGTFRPQTKKLKKFNPWSQSRHISFSDENMKNIQEKRKRGHTKYEVMMKSVRVLLLWLLCLQVSHVPRASSFFYPRGLRRSYIIYDIFGM